MLQLPYELLFSEGKPGVVRVFSVQDCLLMNRLFPNTISGDMLKQRKEKVITQAIRIKEKDKKDNTRCQYFYGSKISESDLISKIGIMQV